MILSPYDAEDHGEIREGVRKLCAQFPGEYWRKLDEKREYPTEFVNALTEAGWLSVLIPEEYGGSGLGLSAAAAILETIQSEVGNGGACHAQMYIMGTILRHGSEEQKRQYLPKIASGEVKRRSGPVNGVPNCSKPASSRSTATMTEASTYMLNVARQLVVERLISLQSGFGVSRDALLQIPYPLQKRNALVHLTKLVLDGLLHRVSQADAFTRRQFPHGTVGLWIANVKSHPGASV